MGDEAHRRLMKEEDIYVTKQHLLEKEIALNKEIREVYEKSAEKIGAVDNKVDDLRDLVLPLLESSKATADNTEKMSTSLDKFIDKQSDINSDVIKRINKHEVEFAKRKGKIESLSESSSERLEEKKMKNSTKGIIIGGIITIIVTLIGIAPAIVTLLFE